MNVELVSPFPSQSLNEVWYGNHDSSRIITFTWQAMSRRHVSNHTGRYLIVLHFHMHIQINTNLVKMHSCAVAGFVVIYCEQPGESKSFLMPASVDPFDAYLRRSSQSDRQDQLAPNFPSYRLSELIAHASIYRCHGTLRWPKATLAGIPCPESCVRAK